MTATRSEPISRPIDEPPGRPAYQTLMHALSDWANGQPEGVTWDDAEDRLAAMFRAARFADCCDACEGPRLDTMTWPHRIELRGESWWHCHYRCDAGHTWTCGYADELPDLR